jgi:hypothetical protein
LATYKQVKYALLLLSQNGYSTRYMNSEFKRLGASMRERQGTVEAWLYSLDVGRASSVIDLLVSAATRKAARDALARAAAAAMGPQLPKL